MNNWLKLRFANGFFFICSKFADIGYMKPNNERKMEGEKERERKKNLNPITRIRCETNEKYGFLLFSYACHEHEHFFLFKKIKIMIIKMNSQTSN